MSGMIQAKNRVSKQFEKRTSNRCRGHTYRFLKVFAKMATPKQKFRPKYWRLTADEKEKQRQSSNSYIQAYIKTNYQDRSKLTNKLKKLCPVGNDFKIIRTQLTALFLHCNRIIELEQIMDLNEPRMNAINGTAAMGALARIVKLRKVRAATELSLTICKLSARIMSVMERELNVGKLQLRETMNYLSSISQIAQECTDLQFVEDVEETFLDLLRAALVVIKKMSVRDISDALVAMARTKWYDPQIFDEFAYYLVQFRSPQDFSTQDISMSLWAIGKTKHGNKKVIQRLVDFAKHHFVSLNDNSIANITWSLALIRYREHEFMNMVEYGIIRRLLFNNRDRTHLNQMMFALARFGVSDKRTMETLIQTITGGYFDFRDQHNALISIYTLAILQCDALLAQNLLNLVLSYVPLDRLRPEQLRQIRTAHQLFMANGQTLNLPVELEQSTRNVQMQYIQKVKQQPHELVDNVCSILRQNQGQFVWIQDWEERCVIGQGELCVHLAFHYNNGRRLALQVMDSNCFMLNEPDRMLCQAIASIGLIKYYGWEPIVLPVFEWNQMKSEDDKLSYLLRLLQ